MSRLRGLSILFGGLIGLAVYGTAEESRAELILDVGPGGGTLPCGPCGNGVGSTFGWAFDVTSTISVDGVGVWNAGANGIGPAVQAGLWTNAGILLASATISDASSPVPSNGDGEWLFEDIPLLTLSPGRYVIGSIFFDSTPLSQFFTAFTTIPEITYIESRIPAVLPDSGLDIPTGSLGSDGVFGPTLRLPEAPVPVPATLALFAIAMAGLGIATLRRIAA